MGIKMLDHLIINGINKNERYSFKDEYMLEDLEENYIFQQSIIAMKSFPSQR